MLPLFQMGGGPAAPVTPTLTLPHPAHPPPSTSPTPVPEMHETGKRVEDESVVYVRVNVTQRRTTTSQLVLDENIMTLMRSFIFILSRQCSVTVFFFFCPNTF